MAAGEMNVVDAQAFTSLFREAYQKCFSYDLATPLTESESHHFSNEIFESTGLVIGWKSLKNYSYYALDAPQSKPENPSSATLDTLARYVVGAPATDEVQRKKKERHYPYWFQYREAFSRSKPDQTEGAKGRLPKRPVSVPAIVAVVTLLALLFIALLFREHPADAAYTEEFYSVEEDSLFRKGWFVQARNTEYWKQRGVMPDHLTLFTLRGDNWPDSGNVLKIQNLLLREIPFDCFATELHMTAFFPTQNWQQAGMLLLEDTSFTGKSLRMSIGYNDYTGGFAENREIIIQAITSWGNAYRKPEEIAHHQIFAVEQGLDTLIRANLAYSTLRIEKESDRFRLLYSNGSMKNAAFKEVVRTTFDLRPRYLGLFAIKGFVDQSDEIPVSFDTFNMTKIPCEDS